MGRDIANNFLVDIFRSMLLGQVLRCRNFAHWNSPPLQIMHLQKLSVFIIIIFWVTYIYTDSLFQLVLLQNFTR